MYNFKNNEALKKQYVFGGFRAGYLYIYFINLDK